jgi:hypothetical protein
MIFVPVQTVPAFAFKRGFLSSFSSPRALARYIIHRSKFQLMIVIPGLQSAALQTVRGRIQNVRNLLSAILAYAKRNGFLEEG